MGYISENGRYYDDTTGLPVDGKPGWSGTAKTEGDIRRHREEEEEAQRKSQQAEDDRRRRESDSGSAEYQAPPPPRSQEFGVPRASYLDPKGLPPTHAEDSLKAILRKKGLLPERPPEPSKEERRWALLARITAEREGQAQKEAFLESDECKAQKRRYVEHFSRSFIVWISILAILPGTLVAVYITPSVLLACGTLFGSAFMLVVAFCLACISADCRFENPTHRYWVGPQFSWDDGHWARVGWWGEDGVPSTSKWFAKSSPWKSRSFVLVSLVPLLISLSIACRT